MIVVRHVFFSQQLLQYMARFVDDESKSKRGGLEMDISGWPRFNYADVPHQRNTIDCGEPKVPCFVGVIFLGERQILLPLPPLLRYASVIFSVFSFPWKVDDYYVWFSDHGLTTGWVCGGKRVA